MSFGVTSTPPVLIATRWKSVPPGAAMTALVNSDGPVARRFV
jgi:hypothetical protein